MESQSNNAYNKTIGDTPFHILYGYHPSFIDTILCHSTSQETWDDVNQLQEKVRERILQEHLAWKNRFDNKHAEPEKYQVGEVVYIRKLPEPTGDYKTTNQISWTTGNNYCFTT